MEMILLEAKWAGEDWIKILIGPQFEDEWKHIPFHNDFQQNKEFQ
jgi:hypothetical protein